MARGRVGVFVVEDILQLAVQHGIGQMVCAQEFLFLILDGRWPGGLTICFLPFLFLSFREVHEELVATVLYPFVGIGYHIVHDGQLIEPFPFVSRHGLEFVVGVERAVSQHFEEVTLYDVHGL